MLINNLPPSLLQAALKALGPEGQTIVFQEGEIIEGRVLKVLSSRQALLRVGGMEVMALTPSGLSEGQGIVGRVERVSPKITVSLLRGESTQDVKTTELIRLLMPGKTEIGRSLGRVIEAAGAEGLAPRAREAMRTMAGALEKALSLDIGSLTPEKAREALKNSGLFLEAALRAAAEGKASRTEIRAALEADIKALLGKTLATVEEEVGRLAREVEGAVKTTGKGGAPSPRAGEGGTAAQAALMDELAGTRQAAREIKDAVNNIELNQLINGAAKESPARAEAPMMYQLPFVHEGLIQTARLYIQPRKEKESAEGKTGKRKETSRIVFMLSMSRLGPVRVDLDVSPKRIGGSVYVVDEEAAAHARRLLPELAGPLEAAGYETWIEVRAAGKDFITERIENRSPILAERGLISLKV
ncbi:MAG: hypothetical protein ACNS63_03775 [Candidatus Nitrospinota bacterium M3_3B_026]